MLMSWLPLAQALFSVGGLLAVVYHICHLDPRGLHTSRILGVTGPVWRSWDILFAQWLLGRTVGQVVGAQHPLIICELGLAHIHRVAIIKITYLTYSFSVKLTSEHKMHIARLRI